jgi:hypothetical protein
MRAKDRAWDGIIKSRDGQIFINESLTRSDAIAKVVSSLPGEGRVDIVAHRQGDYLIRPPHWAPRDQVRLLRSGQASSPVWSGPGMAYVLASHVKPGEALTLSYPLVRFKEVWGNWPSQPNLKLTILWSGNSVVDMQPKGKGLPIDFAHLPAIPSLPENEHISP